MSQLARGWWRIGHEALLGMLCPPECVWCRLPEPGPERLCPVCYKYLWSSYYCCQRCATPLPSVVPNGDCFRCRDKGWRFQRIIALGPYRGRRREAVILMKKPSGEALRQAAGRLLAQRMQQSLVESTTAKCPASDPLQPPWIIPVPNHWTHGFSRAANTAGQLAFAIADVLDWPVKTRIVRRIRKTRKQGMLAWTERARNVRGAFEIRAAESLSGRHVFLVDDVLTSGATAAELARTLRAAGAQRVDVAVIARGTGARESPADISSASPPE